MLLQAVANCYIMLSMKTTAIRISTEFLQEATHYATINFRSVPKQIEYWAMLGKCAEENPDLPLNFIKEALLARKEAIRGEVSTFEFRGE